MDEQPASSAKRHFDETWLKRAMERMECRLQVMIHSSLDPVSHSMNGLEACVMAIEERVASREEDEQEDDSPFDSGQQRSSLADPPPGNGQGVESQPTARWTGSGK